MKLRTKVASLLDAYSLVAQTLDSKGAGAKLYLQANDKSGFLYLYSTNLISETATKTKAEVEIAGEVMVDPKKLSAGLAGIPKDTPVTLALTPTGNALKVTAGKTSFSLASDTTVRDLSNRMKSIPAKESPVSTIPVSELVAFTKRAIFCIPNDETGQRQSLSALKLVDDSTEVAFATDGEIAVKISSQKTQRKGSGVGETGLLIPAQSLAPLTSIATKKVGESVSVILTPNRNRVFFKFADGTHFGSMTMATNYPNLNPVIDQQVSYKFKVGRESLKQVLTRAGAFAGVGSKRTIEIDLTEDHLQVNAIGDDSLSDQIPITYESIVPTGPIKLGMNLDRLFNIAASSKSESLILGFTDPQKPLIVLDSEGDEDDRINVKYVMAGVRLGPTR